MNDFAALRLLDRFRGRLAASGYDYAALRVILQAKLTMDGRRPSGLMQSFGKGADPDSVSTRSLYFSSLWIYTVLSAFMLPILFIGTRNPMLGMSLLISAQIFLIASLVMSDFAAVMLDTRDRAILGSKPVLPKTAGLARLLYAAHYMFWVVASMTALPLIVLLFLHGPLAFLVYFAELFLLSALILSVAGGIYYIILRRWDGSKLKDMINYAQIALAISVFSGYHIGSRLINFNLLEQSLEPQWWWALLPPLWFAAPFELIAGRTDVLLYTLAALAITVPVLSFLLYVRLLPAFERAVHKLAEKEGESKQPGMTSERTHKDSPVARAIGAAAKTGRRITVRERLIGLLFPDFKDRALVQFAYTMFGREREFKLKTYPALAYSVLFPFLMPLLELKDEGFRLGSLAPSMGMSLYFVGMCIPALIALLPYSSRPTGAWIYSVVSGLQITRIQRAGLAAGLLKFFLPLFTVTAIGFLVILQAEGLPYLAAVTFSLSIYAVICYRTFPKSIPFAEPYPTGNGGKVGYTFLHMFILVALFGIHFLVHSLAGATGVWIYAGVLAPLSYFVWKYGFK
ncbi:hypothetical protein M3223_15450 [Paenibacillus pasadenensis]|uniref:hypothetical protein n=1 Tax=Paenibacillus pasadenensis TaxID=217090 RepID=UPI00203D285F|nr:hypothetical protein [Paenibacillus pasadenensis]MCM3748747.1 hypothetical protein [Paenibacillus pasadenensis]